MRIGTIIAVAATVAVVGGFFALKEYNRTPAGADTKKVTHSVTAGQLMAEFQEDETSADLKYVGTQEQVIEVHGTIRDIDPNGDHMVNVILDTGDPLAGVVCEFNTKDLPSDWQEGDEVAVLGFCKGMLMDVLLQRCVAAR
jgi:hypothetical protein